MGTQLGTTRLDDRSLRAVPALPLLDVTCRTTDTCLLDVA